eukprot:jgi/Chlat1/42/ChrspC236667S00922
MTSEIPSVNQRYSVLLGYARVAATGGSVTLLSSAEPVLGSIGLAVGGGGGGGDGIKLVVVAVTFRDYVHCPTMKVDRRWLVALAAALLVAGQLCARMPTAAALGDELDDQDEGFFQDDGGYGDGEQYGEGDFSHYGGGDGEEAGGFEEDMDVDETDVFVLSKDNFTDVINQYEHVLVEFYAPWCGHCQHLKPEWAAAATELKSYPESMALAKVDATQEVDLSTEYEVQGYPTIIYFHKGKQSPYTAGRTRDDIVQYLLKRAGPPARTISTIEEAHAIKESSSVTIVGFFASFDGPEWEQFTQMAADDYSVGYAQTNDTEVADILGMPAAPPAIALFKSFDEKISHYEGKLEQEDIAAFVREHKLPLVIPFSEQTTESIFNSGIDKQVILMGLQSDLESYSDSFAKAAAGFRGKVIFVTVDFNDEAIDPVIEFFGVTKEDPTTVVAFLNTEGSGKKYRGPTPLAVDTAEQTFKTFASDFVEGRAQQFFKSEPIPEEDTDGHVKLVVGKTFADIVLDETKDVFIDLYAPWCGHCRSLEPAWQTLAELFKDYPSLVIAKMDATTNEHESVMVEAFPTLMFFPAGKKTAIQFDESRSLKAMAEFLVQHATHSKLEMPELPEGADVEAEDNMDDMIDWGDLPGAEGGEFEEIQPGEGDFNEYGDEIDDVVRDEL